MLMNKLPADRNKVDFHVQLSSLPHAQTNPHDHHDIGTGSGTRGPSSEELCDAPRGFGPTGTYMTDTRAKKLSDIFPKARGLKGKYRSLEHLDV